MLENATLFTQVEKASKQQIDAFEAENGPVKGRMMITETEIPENLKIKISDPDVKAFQATFDFYDIAIGIALNVKTLKVATGLWMTPQSDNAVEPDEAWINFFIETLANELSDPTGYGMPIYSLVTDTADITLVPTKP